MPDRLLAKIGNPVLNEEPLQFGEGGRLCGILSLAAAEVCGRRQLPVFVFFNAGSLHRVGPHRLYVRLARALSCAGFSSLRVDLAGKGNSPPRPGLKGQDSVAADFDAILRIVADRFGRVPLVLVGLCSGADDAIRLAPKDASVVGLVLLDPVCARDPGFAARAFLLKYTKIDRYVNWMRRRFGRRNSPRLRPEDVVDPLSIRNAATHTQLRSALEAIAARGGRALSVFTNYSLSYYNQVGQLGRVSGVEGCARFCTEVFCPQADHTYTLELHRRWVIEVIMTWASGFVPAQTRNTE